MMLNSVVLPAPFGPMTAKIAPGSTMKLGDAKAHVVDREQPTKALANSINREKRRHDRRPFTPSLAASHGHTPPGSAITTASKQSP